MSKTVKLVAKIPKKNCLKKLWPKQVKVIFFYSKTYFLSFYSYFSPFIFYRYNFLSTHFYVKSIGQILRVVPIFCWFYLGILAENLRVLSFYTFLNPEILFRFLVTARFSRFPSFFTADSERLNKFMLFGIHIFSRSFLP